MASTNFPFGSSVVTGEANFSAAATGDTPLIVSANAGQTVDVVDITNSTGSTKYLAVTSAGNVTTSGNISVGGTLSVTGAVTNSGNLTVTGNLAVTGTTALTGALTVTAITGPTTLTGALTVTGALVAGGASVASHQLAFDSNLGSYGVKITDSGAGTSATPSKTLRINRATGAFEVVNNAYSSAVFVIPDSGANNVQGSNYQLLAAIQELGAAGIRVKNVGAGDNWEYSVNYKTTMTNTPSSITLTVVAGTLNFTSVAALNISKYGFRFNFVAAAAGDAYWLGSYTTVGN